MKIFLFAIDDPVNFVR